VVWDDQNGNLFFMCENGDIGFYRQDKNTGQIEKINFGLDDKAFYSIVGSGNYFLFDQRENCVWTVTNKLFKLDLETQQLVSPSNVTFSLTNSTYNPLILLANGHIFYGNTLDKLSVFNPETKQDVYISIQGTEALRGIKTRCFYQKSDNQVWIGTESNGIYLIDLNGTILKHYHINSRSSLSNNDILYLHQDDKSLWAATLGGGLNKIDLKTNEIHVYNKLNGLPDNNVVSILEDQEKLWLATYSGLTCFDKSKETFQTFFQEDGLTHNEFNYSSSYMSKDGQMYFGGMNGINSFSPSDLAKSQLSPALKLTKFVKHDQRLDSLVETDYINDHHSQIVIGPSISFF
jgi:ligand-binding sensor domain-containing protein